MIPLSRTPASVPGERSEAISDVRSATRLETTDRARRRVEALLRSVGLADEARLASLAERIIADAAAHVDAGDLVAAGVERAQGALARWIGEHLPPGRRADPEQVRSLARARPELFLEETAPDVVRRFLRGTLTGPPRPLRMAPQDLGRAGLPRWALGLAPPAVATALATHAFARAVGAHLGAPHTLLWCLLFGLLFGLSALGAFVATVGLVARLRRRHVPESSGPLPKTAVVMPIYGESTEAVFTSLAAMRDALREEPGGECFELFVLSDTRDPEIAAEEERCARRVGHEDAGRVPLYYRRRRDNVRKKSGNIEQFLERWGPRYRYVVVLDADSLVGATTLVRLVRRMEASPEVGLLQLPVAIVRAETAFARALAFATSVYGPVFTSGLAAWVGPDGNYYGHNAILRVDAFVACCGLPALAGEPPLGGHILSHDFVEAALLRRGGYEVRLADDLDESFEEAPPTLGAYVARDRRWCQGNLQHLRILFARGLRPMSRLHLALGALAYLAGPAWLGFAVLGIVHAASRPDHGARGPWLGALLFVSIGLLLVARCLAVVATALDRDARRRHGGLARLVTSAFFELLFSTWLAPRLMLAHTRMILAVMAGRAVGWQPQERVGRAGTLRSSLAEHGGATALGFATGLALLGADPSLALWASPVWLPLALVVPFDLLCRHPGASTVLARLGVFRVPTEADPASILRRRESGRGLALADAASRFRDLVLDPVLNARHVAAKRRAPGRPAPASVRSRALALGPALLDANERSLLLDDPDAMEWLHRKAWAVWPVETWQLGRERPLVPVEACAAGSFEST